MSKVKLVFECEQRSPEWFALRLGKASGSGAIGLSTPARLKTYIIEKATELLTGQIEDVWVSDAMKWGVEYEPIARDLYQETADSEVVVPAVATNDDFQNAVLSPDGLILNNGAVVGAVEIKCPSSKKHISNILEGGLPSDYVSQVAWYFVIIDTLEYLDFISYDPRVPSYPFYQIRVTREMMKKEIDKLTEGYHLFSKGIEDALKLFSI